MDNGQRDDVSMSTLAKLLREEATKEMKITMDYAAAMELQEASHHAGIALGLTRANELMTQLFMKENR